MAAIFACACRGRTSKSQRDAGQDPGCSRRIRWFLPRSIDGDHGAVQDHRRRTLDASAGWGVLPTHIPTSRSARRNHT
jgi:hypothetical protein